jgi:hypothetical protein
VPTCICGHTELDHVNAEGWCCSLVTIVGSPVRCGCRGFKNGDRAFREMSRALLDDQGRTLQERLARRGAALEPTTAPEREPVRVAPPTPPPAPPAPVPAPKPAAIVPVVEEKPEDEDTVLASASKRFSLLELD